MRRFTPIVLAVAALSVAPSSAPGGDDVARFRSSVADLPGSSRRAPDGRVHSESPVILVGTDFLDEGFEGTFPPAGWVRTGNPVVTGPNRWHAEAGSNYVRTGSQSAAVFWQDERTQDEKLASPALDLTAASPTGLRLSFWWYGNTFWASDADVQVHASVDGVVWTELWTMTSETVTGWAWRQKVLDLSTYAGGTAYVRFRYHGRNGADLALDDVRVGYIANPSPPPNDDCAGALANGNTIGPSFGVFSRSGDNSLATNDYPLPSGNACTGYVHAGRDMVWTVDMPATSYFTATMTTTGHWDDTLFLVSDCGDPAGSCIAGDNAVPDGSKVTTINHASVPVRYYLVASGYAAGAGEFRLDGILGNGTAIESTTWGRLKARYR